MAGWLRLLAAVGAVLLGAGAWLLWFFFRHPLAFNAARERMVVRLAGYRSETVSTSVGNVRAFVKGNGSCLVFLHGAGDHAGTWAAVAPAFSSRFRVVLVDLPGHGASEPTQGPLPLDVVLRGTREAVVKLCGTGGVLVGNSLGAWLACLLAADEHAAPLGIVLVNGGPIRGEYVGPTLAPASREEARRVMQVLLGPRGKKVPGFVLDDVVRAGKSGAIPRLLAALDSWSGYVWQEEELARLARPVLLLWGAEDGLFPRAYAENLAAHLPRSETRFLDGCGHVPQRQCPQAVAAALGPWLASLTEDRVAR